jgi:hypothetical protein
VNAWGIAGVPCPSPSAIAAAALTLMLALPAMDGGLQARFAPRWLAPGGFAVAQQKPWAEEVLEAIGRRRGGAQPPPGAAPQRGGESGQGAGRQEGPPVGVMPRGESGGTTPQRGGPDRGPGGGDRGPAR